MRRLRHVHLKMILPCCIRTFAYDEAHVKLLAKCAIVPVADLQDIINGDRLVGDTYARRLHEATDGKLKAQSVPHDSSEAFINELHDYVKKDWCTCKRIQQHEI